MTVTRESSCQSRSGARKKPGNFLKKIGLRASFFGLKKSAAPGVDDEREGEVGPARSSREALHLIKVRSLFAITSRRFHPVQRPENINNLYPVVTSRRESKSGKG